jgi:hypothetical protein
MTKMYKKVPSTASEALAFVLAAAQGLDPEEVMRRVMAGRPLSVAGRQLDPNLSYLLDIITNPDMTQPIEISTVVTLYSGAQAKRDFGRLYKLKGPQFEDDSGSGEDDDEAVGPITMAS